MLATVLLALLPLLAVAKPVNEKRWTASADAGSTTSDVFPPTGTKVNSQEFPGETEVGYPGPTLTGIEPAAVQTAVPYAGNTGAANEFPLVADPAYDSSYSEGFDIFRYWGNLSPQYSVPSSYYGLPNASPNTPDSCSITQYHLLYRHGARYPTSGAAPSTFAAKVHNATQQSGGFTASGDLDFLNTWTYKLGTELLTPFGRLQNFELGVQTRQNYGYLLNNFTEQGALPVFRTESQDRMVKTAENFAAGMFGVPEYMDQVNIEIMVETPGVNNTGAPYETCTNANVAARGSIGSTAATKFANNAFNSTIARLNGLVTGISFTPTDAIAMLQLCSYETDALGYSAFCKLFTKEDFENYEYYYDISFWYNNGFGSPTSAAQGLGFLQEYIARFENEQISTSSSEVNSTLDGSTTYFPTNQSIYADATHEVVVCDTLSAFNLTSVFGSTPLDPTTRGDYPFKSSQVVPFATRFAIQVMECSNYSPTKQARFLVNEAVVPLPYSGCPSDENGLCAFDTVLAGMKARAAEIDYDYACYGNYTASPGVNYNGLPPPRS